ncbi:MAG: hypothetical protein AVDCRST_MAG48-511, partial [uncultured Friedmanniella sp.]
DPRHLAAGPRLPAAAAAGAVPLGWRRPRAGARRDAGRAAPAGV